MPKEIIKRKVRAVFDGRTWKAMYVERKKGTRFYHLWCYDITIKHPCEGIPIMTGEEFKEAIRKSSNLELVEIEQCPKCGADYDPEKDEILECPECGMPGATSCCNPGGRGCLCVECEEGKKDEPEDKTD